jgi:hypothetical protein
MIKDITPEDSVTPIYQEIRPNEDFVLLQNEAQSIIDIETERQELKESALSKLEALGLTETEAKIIIGLE